MLAIHADAASTETWQRRCTVLGTVKRTRIAVGLPGLLLVALTLSVAITERSADAQPPVAPPSFAQVAPAAQAASIVIRRPADPDGDLVCDEEGDGDECALEGAVVNRRERTVGAGVIVDPRGLALTSARAVLRQPGFEVALVDGVSVRATIIGVDRRTDVAVLKLERENGAAFPYLPLGDSDRLEAGAWVIAVGAPLGWEGTVTAGVITAMPTPGNASPLGQFLQTDAAMSPGNAGGPVVTAGGEVVGLGSTLSGNGIGYVLPSKTVRKVYLEILERGRVRRSWLGLTTQTLGPDLAHALGARAVGGVLVTDVLPDGPAASAGLRPGDIVLEVNGARISSRAQLDRATSGLTIGGVARLKLRRTTRDMTVAVKVDDEPDEWALAPELARARQLLGIEARPITPNMGAVTKTVTPGSAAARAGLEPGDVIREVNRQSVRTMAEFRAAVRNLNHGAPVLMLLQRGDVALYIVMQAAE
jgi:S1-C subfamily serine protease